MQRRTILKCLSGCLAAISASLVAIPGAGFVVELTRRKRAHGASIVQRVVRLCDLAPNQPLLVPVLGERQDAWTKYPSETIGRVWIVRQTDESLVGAEAKVVALSSICPHLGCQIQLDAAHDHFVCPCHKAAFATGGERAAQRTGGGHRNQAPRGMDSLECRVVQDEPTGDWWVEVKYEEFEEGLTTKTAKS